MRMFAINRESADGAFRRRDPRAEVAPGLPDDYFATIVEDFLATGKGRRGLAAQAPCVLVAANQLVPFAVAWLERRQ
jgi:aminoglycoside 3-N-acetyltransferase